jgi:hypothetical protein
MEDVEGTKGRRGELRWGHARRGAAAGRAGRMGTGGDDGRRASWGCARRRDTIARLASEGTT